MSKFTSFLGEEALNLAAGYLAGLVATGARGRNGPGHRLPRTWMHRPAPTSRATLVGMGAAEGGVLDRPHDPSATCGRAVPPDCDRFHEEDPTQ